MSAGDELQALLTAGSGSVTLRIDASNDVTEACNLPRLRAWLKLEGFQPRPGAGWRQMLDTLFDAPQVQRIQSLLEARRAAPDPAPSPVLLLPARTERLALRQRWFEVSLHPGDGQQVLALLTDVSERQELDLALKDARTASDLALTVLRTDAAALRALRDAGALTVMSLRTTLRLPARSQEALQEKLARMQLDADGLGGQAQVLSLATLALACDQLTSALVALRQQQTPSGDALLPLAPRIDAIAVALSELDRIDGQRAPLPAPPAPRTQASRQGASSISTRWHEASENRWRTYVHQMSDAHGVLARLKFVDAELVPARYRRHVDSILHPLIDNALQHGIEDLECRLKAHKSAAGQITVTFRDLGAEGFEMTVHDDGDGFDVDRIGRAAVASGLLTEATLEMRDEAKLVGLVFRPNFTTEGLPGNAGQGRGMASVRRTITRLGGKIAVSTKRHRYTLFTIRLPALEAAAASIQRQSRTGS